LAQAYTKGVCQATGGQGGDRYAIVPARISGGQNSGLRRAPGVWSRPYGRGALKMGATAIRVRLCLACCYRSPDSGSARL